MAPALKNFDLKRQLKGLKAKLDEFPAAIQNNIMRRALTEASRIPAEAIKQRAIAVLNSEKTQERTGLYIDSIVPKRARFTKVGGEIQVIAGVGLDGKNKHRSLWHLLEYGHVLILHGKKVGFVQGFPHWRPGFRSTVGEIFDHLEYALGKHLGKEIRKLSKKRG